MSLYHSVSCYRVLCLRTLVRAPPQFIINCPIPHHQSTELITTTMNHPIFGFPAANYHLCLCHLNIHHRTFCDMEIAARNNRTRSDATSLNITWKSLLQTTTKPTWTITHIKIYKTAWTKAAQALCGRVCIGWRWHGRRSWLQRCRETGVGSLRPDRNGAWNEGIRPYCGVCIIIYCIK